MKDTSTSQRLLFHEYEHRTSPVASKKVFLKRLYLNSLIAIIIMLSCLSIGIVGYKIGGPMSWIDAIHNASMILSGMGPVAEVRTIGGKLFSSFYALFSGVAFITNIGLLIAPLAHRFFHILHAE